MDHGGDETRSLREIVKRLTDENRSLQLRLEETEDALFAVRMQLKLANQSIAARNFEIDQATIQRAMVGAPSPGSGG